MYRQIRHFHWRSMLMENLRCRPLRIWMLHRSLLRLVEEISSLPLTSSIIDTIELQRCCCFLQVAEDFDVSVLSGRIETSNSSHIATLKYLLTCVTSFSLPENSSTSFRPLLNIDRSDRVQPLLLHKFNQISNVTFRDTKIRVETQIIYWYLYIDVIIVTSI